MEEIKCIHALCHYNLKIFPKYGDRLAPCYHRKLLLKWLWHIILVKEALVYLCLCIGSSELNKEFAAV